MSAGRRDLLLQSFIADGTIERGRLVKLTATGEVTKASAATDKIIGISNPTFDYSDNQPVDIWLLGVSDVRAGGTIAVGDFITSDANGKGVAGTGTFRSIGVALASAVLDEIFPVHIFPSGN